YTFTIDQNAPAKPGSAGRAGINQMVRVVRLGAAPPDGGAAARGEGGKNAPLPGGESLEGHLRRPGAGAQATRRGWGFFRDTGYFYGGGELFFSRPARRTLHTRREDAL